MYSKRILVESIAKSTTKTMDSFIAMKNILVAYSKDEICDLMGIAYKSFLEENCNLLIKIPFLIIIGEFDNTGKVKSYCRAWQKDTGSRLVIVPNAAHNSNYDNPEFVNIVIVACIFPLFVVLNLPVWAKKLLIEADGSDLHAVFHAI